MTIAPFLCITFNSLYLYTPQRANYDSNLKKFFKKNENIGNDPRNPSYKGADVKVALSVKSVRNIL